MLKNQNKIVKKIPVRSGSVDPNNNSKVAEKLFKVSQNNKDSYNKATDDLVMLSPQLPLH